MAARHSQARLGGNTDGEDAERCGHARKRSSSIRSIVREATRKREVLVQHRRGVSRFLNNSEEARRRKGKRNAKRMAARKRSRDTRTGSRAGCLPCCGKRPSRCKCWGAEAPKENRRLVKSLNRRVLKRTISHVARADIVTFRDTADMPEYRLQCLRDFREDMA